MKKILSILLCGLVLLGMTGCTTDTESSATDKEKNKKTSFNVNETAVHKDVHYTVTNVEYSNGTEFNKPSDGKNYVIVTINIENKSDEKISYNALDWKMVNSQGQEDSETITIVDSDTNLSSGDLAAGGNKTGTLVFEEDVNETSLKLLYYPTIIDKESAFEFVIK